MKIITLIQDENDAILQLRNLTQEQIIKLNGLFEICLKENNSLGVDIEELKDDQNTYGYYGVVFYSDSAIHDKVVPLRCKDYASIEFCRYQNKCDFDFNFYSCNCFDENKIEVLRKIFDYADRVLNA